MQAFRQLVKYYNSIVAKSKTSEKGTLNRKDQSVGFWL